jgi:hypothetical protein
MLAIYEGGHMKKLLFLFAFAILTAGQPLVAENNSDGSDDMDKRREKKANEIITEMNDSGASQSDINAQKRANKQAFGHEGEIDF